jgi:hypothetical protein
MKIQLVPEELSAKIKVIGIGGAGGNAINDMIKSEMAGVDFVAANSDNMSLERNLAPIKIQLGPTVTRGLGAGGNPEKGREAAREEADRIRQCWMARTWSSSPRAWGAAPAPGVPGGGRNQPGGGRAHRRGGEQAL